MNQINKTIEILIFIYNNKKTNITNITKKLKISCGRTHIIINDFLKRNIIKKNKQGREQIITLTKKGYKISQNLQYFYKEFK